ncbi:MAG TPA: FAD-dependent oxidoreductase [Gaiellaceae bacterium]|nr:FAD-dependent oxidoreductase [Gaiellaceae bacterium]
MTRIAVVGAGIMGCATAWALVARGADVTLVEQFEPGHDRGSSHGRSRIVRLSYPDPEWVRLAAEARAGWAELEVETGRTLLQLHGLVELAASRELTSGRGLTANGVEHRRLSAAEARALGVVLPDGWSALYEPSGGIVHADAARAAFLDAALARGARLETGRRVSSPGQLDADVVVVTAGAWVESLVPGLPVRVTRETTVYFRHEGPPLPSIVEIVEIAGGHATYALHDPVHGVKAGVHHAGAEADPDETGSPDERLVAATAAWVAERLPDVAPEPVGAETCLYTTTPDESFVLERRGRVVVGSACSGHGFKFAPSVGRRLAELALG